MKIWVNLGLGLLILAMAVGIYKQGYDAGYDAAELKQISNTVKVNEKRKAVPRADTADLLDRLQNGTF